jgi:AraC-like DNA-binding protein
MRSLTFVRKKIRCAWIIALLFISPLAQAQITILINKVPPQTPPGDILFLTGSFNEWDPGHEQYQFTRNADGHYLITLPTTIKQFDYKITRGSWATVEGDLQGKKISDHSFKSNAVGADTLVTQVMSWEDLGMPYQWNVVVNEIPSNTPFDGNIFISGSFNDWKADDPSYKLTRLDDGTYAINIGKVKDTLWFKFHRGDWSSVECRYNGRTRYNRIAVWDSANTSNTLVCAIDGWEDLTNGTNLLYSFILLACALQAVVLIIATTGIKSRSRKLCLAMVLLLAFTAIVLIGRTPSYNRVLFEWSPKLLLLSDIVYFLYAPLFYGVIKRLSGLTLRTKYLCWLFVLPVVIQIAFYFPLLILPNDQFILAIIDKKFTTLFMWMEIAAWLYNGVCWAFCQWLLYKEYYAPAKLYGYRNSYAYITTLMTHAACCIAIWLISHLIFGIGNLTGFDSTLAHEISIDVLWVTFALSVPTHAFLMLRYPELFRIVKEEVDEKKVTVHQRENIDALKSTLAMIMKKEKPYLNSKLTLQDLAEMLQVNIHTLSRVINEGYRKNFFDFINEYRIDEFKRLVNIDQYKNYTFLAIAMEVGFSSKTTFNRSFKKSTGKTPREYFNVDQESALEGMES